MFFLFLVSTVNKNITTKSFIHTKNVYWIYWLSNSSKKAILKIERRKSGCGGIVLVKGKDGGNQLLIGFGNKIAERDGHPVAVLQQEYDVLLNVHVDIAESVHLLALLAEAIRNWQE